MIAAVRDAGLNFDSESRTGVVLHMLSGLAIRGRMGLTAIAHSDGQPDQVYDATHEAISSLARAR